MWASSGAVKIGFASRIRLEVSEFLDESLLEAELPSSERRIAKYSELSEEEINEEIRKYRRKKRRR